MDYPTLKTRLSDSLNQTYIYKSDFDIYKSWVNHWLGRELLDTVIPLTYYNQIGSRLRSLDKLSLDPSDKQAIKNCLLHWKVLADMLIALKPLIVKGRKPTDNTKTATAKRTQENTGTCPVCDGNFKLYNGHLVDHGFIVQGARIGSCFGVGFEPWDISPLGAKEYLASLIREQRHLEAVLSTGVSEDKDYKSLKSHLNICNKQIQKFEEKIRNWKPQ